MESATPEASIATKRGLLSTMSLVRRISFKPLFLKLRVEA